MCKYVCVLKKIKQISILWSEFGVCVVILIYKVNNSTLVRYNSRGGRGAGVGFYANGSKPSKSVLVGFDFFELALVLGIGSGLIEKGSTKL